ncbi:hypothetical protein AGABI2DRAFT_116529 [Agaricus bisporus var. bisporus H97]|uniref:hypothetical protein n=1 Tax=Agaricus bisporus var. bisporus (strain H97 / ATCC MYA-4626 / FGSC 10389) TaxID=936046 RepID=UPI00029F72D6|nr:hypothetical protein AGABI2DRAFT_116529 [Agaricus bisporus var. bisporus H97]EKV49493.1 hypothetical protein AGABI2DRAFT_116529 [Agaricus bisporus var. bisporus H97]
MGSSGKNMTTATRDIALAHNLHFRADEGITLILSTLTHSSRLPAHPHPLSNGVLLVVGTVVNDLFVRWPLLQPYCHARPTPLREPFYTPPRSPRGAHPLRPAFQCIYSIDLTRTPSEHHRRSSSTVANDIS